MRPSPKRVTMRRFGVANRVTRDRPEAAAELVRLEYERQRLTRTIASLDERRLLAQQELAAAEDRILWVHGILGIKSPAPAAMPLPPVIERAQPAAPRPPMARPGFTRRPR
jgi:hypothetical protein